MTTWRFLSPRPAFTVHVPPFHTHKTYRNDGTVRYTLAYPTDFVIAEGPKIAVTHVRKGFMFDYASIPSWAQWAMPKLHPDYDRAAFVHDWLYSHHEETDKLAARFGYTSPREFADAVFLVAINPKSWRRPAMHWALRWFGKKAWEKYAPTI